MSELLQIPIGDIRVNPVALRDVDRQSEAFQQLTQSIRENGVLNAINVRRKAGEDGKTFELIDGLQRFSGSQEAGLQTIPAQVLDKSDDDALVAQIVANAHKIDTKPVEYAKGLMRILATNPTWTEAALAAKVNKSPAWVSKNLGLVKLEDSVKVLVDEGKIPVANAYVLAKMPKDEQKNWAERAQTENATAFGSAALARIKEIRDANRKGQEAGEEQFVAVAHLRNKKDIEAELATPAMGPALVDKLAVAKGAKNKDEAAAAGFALGLKWALNLDPDSVEAAKVEYEARKKKEQEAKIRRDADRKARKAEEDKKKAEQASKDAAEAQAKAAALEPAAAVA